MTAPVDAVSVAESLTPEELYMVCLDCFGMDYGYLGRPLMVPPNKESWAIFDSLSDKGLCFLASENGSVGFRASDLAFDVRKEISAVEPQP